MPRHFLRARRGGDSSTGPVQLPPQVASLSLLPPRHNSVRQQQQSDARRTTKADAVTQARADLYREARRRGYLEKWTAFAQREKHGLLLVGTSAGRLDRVTSCVTPRAGRHAPVVTTRGRSRHFFCPATVRYTTARSSRRAHAARQQTRCLLSPCPVPPCATSSAPTAQRGNISAFGSLTPPTAEIGRPDSLGSGAASFPGSQPLARQT